MGGLKKGSQPVRPTGGLFNMALGKEGQHTLQQGLLGEFERAQNRRMDFQNQGAGLGFSAPSNKKFAIDVDARNSVRFDDWGGKGHTDIEDLCQSLLRGVCGVTLLGKDWIASTVDLIASFLAFKHVFQHKWV